MPNPIPQIEDQPGSPTAPGPVPSDFTLGRIVRFGLFVAAILLSANAYTCATWGYFFGVRGWIFWQVPPGLPVIAFILATVLRFRYAHPALTLVYAFSAAWVGALNFAFLAAVACWIAALIAWLGGWPLPHVAVAAFFFSLALLATVYGLINAAWLRVSRVKVYLPHLPEAWRGRTAALVTDLHLGPLYGPRFLRRVIARLRSLQPEIVFISGDLFDGPTLGLDHLAAPWREFSTPGGIFFVTGNHDEFVERSIYLGAAERAGLRVLNNEMISLDGLQIVGIHDAEAENPITLREILRRVQLDRRLPSILLAHRPINLSVAEEEGISLQLSGHTHGGQVWPWSLLVSRIYGRFGHGLHRLGTLQVYTNYGTGTWGPPLRVGTRSEIVLLRLEKEASQG
jgi:predicted MPP superfamily phosphohydrolase